MFGESGQSKMQIRQQHRNRITNSKRRHDAAAAKGHPPAA
jgi:hypothetical protein